MLVIFHIRRNTSSALDTLVMTLRRIPGLWGLSCTRTALSRRPRKFSRSFSYWSKPSSLRLRQIQNGPADIDIMFAVREHGDFSAFDGAGKVLGRAFFSSYNGSAHFDDDKNWTQS
ncbi:hypothetical protein RvY_09915-3 [Ramazzottius varieornatus]|uniref:Peptidase M10 metallopeptidase domain-containing protein n=1 Tax=Ramazzottius varieornatus TaxID=947166 RepID=A0A1D1VFG9_RAMVA|nr:hypothetical protein RvY_09915-3 [Ramazzottius varieornatus]